MAPSCHIPSCLRPEKKNMTMILPDHRSSTMPWALPSRSAAGWGAFKSALHTQAPTANLQVQLSPSFLFYHLMEIYVLYLFIAIFSQVCYRRNERVLQLCPLRKTGKDKPILEDVTFDSDNETKDGKGSNDSLRRAAGTGRISLKVWPLGWCKVVQGLPWWLRE